MSMKKLRLTKGSKFAIDNVVNAIMMEKETEAWQDLIGADPNEMQL